MAKKRGKTKPRTSYGKAVKKIKPKKPIKRAKTEKKEAEKPVEAAKPLKDTLHELEILAEEKKVEGKINGIEKREGQIEKKEAEIISEEKKVEEETEKVEKVEKEIKREVTQKPLKKFNTKDLNKGIIGAFIGVVAHFAFVYGKQIAKDITATRATVLFVFSYVLIVILMYETGYREIKEKKFAGILPIRATVIFITSIAVILIIFILFNQIDFSDLGGLYRQIAVTSVLASLGAGTADLIGRD